MALSTRSAPKSFEEGKGKGKSNKNKFKCYKCGKKGHFKRECLNKSKSNNKSNEKSDRKSDNKLSKKKKEEKAYIA